MFDTETRELTAVRNPLRLFEKFYYDDAENDYASFDTTIFDKKFVKVIVLNKNDQFTFDRFIDRIQQQDIYDLSIQEDFTEFTGESVSDEGLEVEDTTSLLGQYVDNVETVLDKDRIKKEMNELMVEAQTLEIS